MKLLITALLVLTVFVGHSQNLVFEYHFNNGEQSFQEKCILQTDSKNDYFKSMKYIQTLKGVTAALAGGALNVSDLKSKLNYSLVFNKKKETFHKYEVLFGSKIKYEYPNSALNWRILNETKIVEDKQLTKASLQYAGKEWIAWFDKEIPLQLGPYVFRGLPGLITEVYDSDKTHRFILKGQTDEEFEEKYLLPEKEKAYQKVNLKQYLTLQERALTNAYQFYQTNSSMKLPELSEEGKKAYNEKQRKEYQSIEAAF